MSLAITPDRERYHDALCTKINNFISKINRLRKNLDLFGKFDTTDKGMFRISRF